MVVSRTARAPRTARAAVLAAILVISLGALASCKVDRAALAKLVGLQDVNLTAVPDGVYEAAYTITPPPGVMAANKHVRVRVTVAGGRYTKVEVVEPTGLAGSKMAVALNTKIVESQKLSTDAISGATITSTAILRAVQEAVSAAAK